MISRAEQRIPHRKQHREVAAADAPLAGAGIADTDAVVHAMKARAHQQPLADRTEAQPQVGMRQALHQLREHHHRHELRGRHADRLRQQHEQCVADQIVEQVVAVVRPHRHLPLAVVHGVQRPPPAVAVLRAVQGVVGRVEHHEVQHESGERGVGDTRPQRRCKLVQLPAAHTMQRQPAERGVGQWIDGEKQRQPEQAEPVDQGVDHVGADGSTVVHRLHRPQTLQRPDQCQQDHDLQRAEQQPAGGIEGVFHPGAGADGKHQRLHHGFEQRLLHGGEPLARRPTHAMRQVDDEAHRAAPACGTPAACATTLR
jgi:hypothetical protein